MDGNHIRDGMENLVSGMGTSRDKGSQATYTIAEQHAPHELRTAYEASALIQRAIDMPAEDSCREWREWQADSVEISNIEAEEQRLGVQAKVFEARRLARLYGGSALLIGTGASDPMEPLDPETVAKGGIKYLTVLTRYEITGQDYELDVTSPYYKQPKFWTVVAADGQMINLHPSRLVLFHGLAPLRDLGGVSTDGWGRSSLPGMLDALKRVDEIAYNVNSLSYEAKVDVIKIPDLMRNLQQRGIAFEQEVIKRIKLASQAKGINGTLILDALEEYEQKTLSFSGLEAVIDKFMQLASAAVGIPMTLFFMISPGGLSATGESDTRAYYDKVKVEQSLRMGPAMSILDECLIRSALGDRPDDVHYRWKPLWQPTAKERVETAKIAAEAMARTVDAGMVPEEVAGRAVSNNFTESGAFPGMEGYWTEFFGTSDGKGAEFFGEVEEDPPEPEPAANEEEDRDDD